MFRYCPNEPLTVLFAERFEICPTDGRFAIEAMILSELFVLCTPAMHLGHLDLIRQDHLGDGIDGCHCNAQLAGVDDGEFGSSRSDEPAAILGKTRVICWGDVENWRPRCHRLTATTK